MTLPILFSDFTQVIPQEFYIHNMLWKDQKDFHGKTALRKQLKITLMLQELKMKVKKI